jgi:sugar lactone lactonase YvrE
LVRVTVAGTTAVSGTPFTYLLTYGTPVLFAGSSTGATGNTNAQGSNARFNIPRQLASDAQGNIYVADGNNYVIRKIDPSGNVTTASGNFTTIVWGVALDAGGNIYVSPEPSGGSIRKLSAGSNSAVVFGSGFSGTVNDLATDAAGNVYAADRDNKQIKKITPAGTTTVVATLPDYPYGVAIDASGNIYTSLLEFNQIWKIPAGSSTASLFAGSSTGANGNTNGQGTNALLNNPCSLTADAPGNVYVADLGNGLVRKITPDGTVSAVVSISTANGITFDPSGNMYVSSFLNSNIWKVAGE